MSITMVIVSVLAFGMFCSRMKWRIVTLSLIYYMEKKQYSQPNKEEMNDCTTYVIKNFFKDIAGH